MTIRLQRELFIENREGLFQELTRQINEVSFNPLGSDNDEIGKEYLLTVLKTYRALLCLSSDRTHLNKQSNKMTFEEFSDWKLDMLAKMQRHRPHDSERLLRIEAWLVYHINNTEII